MSRISNTPVQIQYHRNLLGIGSSFGTGLITGGILTPNVADDSTFDVSAGSGWVVDNYTDPENPVIVDISWAAFVGVTADFLATSTVSRVAIDGDGNITQQAEPFTDDSYRDCIVLGALVHLDNATITEGNMSPFLPLGYHQLTQFMRMIGAQNLAGNEYTPNGANLLLDRAAGQHWILGAEYAANNKEPNQGTSTADSPETIIAQVFNSGDDTTLDTVIKVGGAAVIQPNAYDDGTGTLNVGNLSGQQATLRFVYFFPVSGLAVVRVGEVIYANLSDATAAMDAEFPFVPEDFHAQGYLRTVIAVLQSATDLSDPSEASFLQINNVRVIR